MNNIIKVKNCLISVSNKKNINSFAKKLRSLGVNIISTGNTFKILRKNKIKATKVEDFTRYPEILDGRVKTLHPTIFGGILADPIKKSHLNQMKKNGIRKIELVVVNLYPFEDSIRKKSSIDEAIENIDIGGPSMIRAAAKNFKSTAVVIDAQDYKKICLEIERFGGISIELRKYLALKVFERTLYYDHSIFNWFNENVSNRSNKKYILMGDLSLNLRYGENPHQKAEMYKKSDVKYDAFYEKLGGKDLSYNNLNDLKTALNLIVEFKKPTSVIIKHSIPCGVSEADSINKAWQKSFLADSLSAFGGVVLFNRKVDENLAKKISSIFLEVVASISFSDNALRILSKKSNLRIIKIKNLKSFLSPSTRHISVFPNSFMVQDFDKININKKMLDIVTQKSPTNKQIEELIFAYKVVKHVKSNAIVISKNKTTVGIGSGNTSRIDSVRFAIQKSSRTHNDETKREYNLNNCVMASDAFFPFTDSIKIAKRVGIKSIIQPGGSINDQKVIDAVNEANISMVFTRNRCFSH
ncbi:MAG: bifunctional phosphoribosylaminoimidazolecarboxamide formyltransferase/inosine monophosphate cyclohydrolase [Rickettsiales bacterium]|nr:bifunctional phosphoribosylaminoimidazolecarboxamide formyltransferase/inosine monophosphate cyclohydrolase [Rickettsiales bacterium]